MGAVGSPSVTRMAYADENRTATVCESLLTCAGHTWTMRVMAKETIVQVIDDIDGSKNAEEVSFAYQGIEYTIDLSKKNRTALERALKPYIEAGTKKSRRNARSTSKRTSGRRDLAA